MHRIWNFKKKPQTQEKVYKISDTQVSSFRELRSTCRREVSALRPWRIAPHSWSVMGKTNLKIEYVFV